MHERWKRKILAIQRNGKKKDILSDRAREKCVEQRRANDNETFEAIPTTAEWVEHPRNMGAH